MWPLVVSGAVPSQLSPLSGEKYDEELEMAKSPGEAQTSIELKTQPADKNTQLRFVKPGLRGGAPPMYAMRRSLSDNSIDEGDSAQTTRALLREKARELEDMWAHRSKHCPPSTLTDTSTDLPTTSLPTTRISLEKSEENLLPRTEVSTSKGESKLSDFDQFGLASESFEKMESTPSLPTLYERTFAPERLYEPSPSYQSDITSSEGGARKKLESGSDNDEGDSSFLPQQIPTEFKFPLRIQHRQTEIFGIRIRSISPCKQAPSSPPLMVPALDAPSEFDDEHILPSVHQSRPRERQSRNASDREIKKKMADIMYKIKTMKAQEANSEIKKPAQQDDWLGRTNLRDNVINLGEDVSSYTMSDHDSHQPWGHHRSISEVRDQREIDMLNEKEYLLKRLKEINDSLKILHLEKLSDPMISQEAERQARLAEEANLQQQWEDIHSRYQRYPLRKEERDSPKLKRSSSGEPLLRKSDQGIQLEITADTLRDEWKKFAQQQALQKQAQQKHALQQQALQEQALHQVLRRQALQELALQQQAFQQQAFQEQGVKQQIYPPQDLQSVCNLLRQELTTLVKHEIPKQVSQIAKVEIKKMTTELLQNVSPRTRDSLAESTDGADSSVSMNVHSRTQGSLTGYDSERPISVSDMASVSEWGSENRNSDMGVTDTQMEDDSHRSRSAEGATPKYGTRHRKQSSISSDKLLTDAPKTKKEKSKKHSEQVKHHKESHRSSAESTVEPKKDASKPQKLRHSRKVSSEEHKDLSSCSDTVDTEDLQKSPRKEFKHGSPKSSEEQVKSHHKKRLGYGDPMDVSFPSDTEDTNKSSHKEFKKSDGKKSASTQISPKLGDVWIHSALYPREPEKIPTDQESVFSKIEPDASKMTTPLYSVVQSIITEDSPNLEEKKGQMHYQYIERPMEIWDEQTKKWKVIPRGQIRTKQSSAASVSQPDDPKVSPRISSKSPQRLQLLQALHKSILQKATKEQDTRTVGSPQRQPSAKPSTSKKAKGKPAEVQPAPSPGFTVEGTSNILMLDTIKITKREEIQAEAERAALCRKKLASQSPNVSPQRQIAHERYVRQLVPPNLGPLHVGHCDQQNVVLRQPKKKSPSPPPKDDPFTRE